MSYRRSRYPNSPDRPEALLDWFTHDVIPEFFPRARLSETDTQKRDQYRARQSRIDASTKATDLESFLDGLQIRLEFREDDPLLIGRMAQLTQKTNQFNLTTRRATTAEIEHWTRSPEHVLIACDYTDRFGDEGTIGLAHLDLGQGRLVNLLLSCRVLGRRVESELLAQVCEKAFRHGHTELIGSFTPTERNGVASEFLWNHGFELRETDGDEVIGRKALT